MPWTEYISINWDHWNFNPSMGRPLRRVRESKAQTL
jgi:hypothetical protein